MVNELLNSLIKKMYYCMVNFYCILINSFKDEFFDDDYIICGILRYVFCGVEFILELLEDSYYGFDFVYMIELICCLFEEYNGGFFEIEECFCNYLFKNILDMIDE